MPIGKNAIKRVENNGYANLKSEAPDMENSTVVQVSAAPLQKKSRAKNPVPKGVTSGGASGTKNPAPKAVIAMEGVVKNTVKKKANPKTVAKIIPLTEEENEPMIEKKELSEDKVLEHTAEKAEEKAIEPAPTPKKSMETEPEFSPVKTAQKLSDKESGVGYTNIGSEIPIYLL